MFGGRSENASGSDVNISLMPHANKLFYPMTLEGTFPRFQSAIWVTYQLPIFQPTPPETDADMIKRIIYESPTTKVSF